MKSFLYCIASAYSSYYADLSGICFVFPNKRSGSFFLNHLSHLSRTPVLAPQVATISDFIESLSGRDVDSRLDLLFRLFDCYRRLMDKSSDNPSEDAEADFDRFRQWGETVLSDFNEIDMHLVEVDELLKNVADYKEITSTFLTPDQCRVMQQYFGYKGAEESPDEFWKDFHREYDEEKGLSEIKSKFKYLWQVMGPLYHSLHESLAAESLTTPGGAYRQAYERVNDLVRNSSITIDECEPLNTFGKVVFVGFNALSRSEHRIMSLLKRMKCRIPGHEEESYADFFWDATGPLFADADNPAMHFVDSNRRFFPMPAWAEGYMSQSDTAELPQSVCVDSAPSNSAQVKIIGSRLDTLLPREPEKLEPLLKSAKVAVVLPNEGLLQPLLYSLPERVENPNLTMGYPLRQTAVVSYMTLLRRLQTHQRRASDGSMGFYYDDLRLMLAHPFCQTMFGSKAIGMLNAELAKMHVFAVNHTHTDMLGEEAKTLFTPIRKDASAQEVVDYMMMALRIADSALQKHGSVLLKGKLERQHIAAYADALRIIEGCLRKYDVKMHFSTLFHLVERLVAGESVSFEGEPLQGLQVMGMLETRLLDFDYLFIPSMNDKVMPRKARARTFIPNIMRRAYGLPPAGYQESIFAYYFFRLISRAKGIWLSYDSRTGDGGGGGVSRYVLQLQHLMAPGHIRFTDFSFIPTSQPAREDVVEKSGYVRERLEEFFNPESKQNMSASVLNVYTSCPMRFFYERVLGLRTDSAPEESIDAATTGNIVHAALMHIYLPKEKREKFLTSPVEITSDFIARALGDNKRVEKIVHRLVNKLHFHLDDKSLDTPLHGSALLTFPGLVATVRNVLRYDMTLAPFRLYGCEVKTRTAFPLSDGRKINMKYSIDRVDRLGTSPEAPFRIVDYKTGKVHLQAEDVADLLTGRGDCQNSTQLMLYANLLQQYVDENFGEESDVSQKIRVGVLPEIYPVATILKARKNNQYPMFGNVALTNHNEINEEFASRLDATFRELFDYTVPFRRTDDIARCRYCALTNICGRN